MSKQEIMIGDVVTSGLEDVTVAPAKAQGFLAFWRSNGGGWQLASPICDTNRDYMRCPYPLHATRDEALASIRKFLPSGGEGRVAFVSL